MGKYLFFLKKEAIKEFKVNKNAFIVGLFLAVVGIIIYNLKN